VLISHDRRLLEKLSRSIVWLDRGQTRRLDRSFRPFRGLARPGAGGRGTGFHKLGRQIAREEDWLRYGVTARRKRNVKRLADLGTLRQRKREHNHQAESTKMAASDGRHLRQARGGYQACVEILRRALDCQ